MQCIPLNGKKFMSFSVPIKKEINSSSKKRTIIYHLKFIDSARQMNASLSTLVDNLFELKSCYCEKKSFDSINLTHKIIKNEAYAIPSCKTCK